MIIHRLQSFTQWWVRLNEPHTQKFGHSHNRRVAVTIFYFSPAEMKGDDQ